MAAIHLPVLLRRTEPHYPEEARLARRQGWVEVRFTVTTDGAVEDACVTDAEPKDLFDQAAVSAVARWRFSPAMRDGRALAMPMDQRIAFHLAAGGALPR
jgi:protein TonB